MTESELAALDERIAALRQEAAWARQAVVAAEAAVAAALAERAGLVERAALAAVPGPAGPGPAALPVGPSRPGLAAGASVLSGGGAPEASTHTVQNALFILGGLLLGIAAIVFTAVAWTTFGVGGRATILGVVTLLALLAPVLALARRLRATAETFAAIGLLLMLLDGYAAWYVDLFHIQTMPTARYAGLVAAITAAFSAGYAAVTRLRGARLAALVVAQPVAALLVAPAEPGATSWSLLLAAVALGNGAVVWRARGALRALAWVGLAGWLLAALVTAIDAFTTADGWAATALAGLALVVVSLVGLLGARLTGDQTLSAIAAGGVVIAVWIAGIVTVDAVNLAHGELLVGTVPLALAVVVALTGRVLPEWLRPGPRWAVVAAAGLSLVVGAGLALDAAGHTALRLASDFSWTLPVTLVLLAVAVAIAVPGPARWPVATVGAILTTLALPAATSLPWWTPPFLDIVATAALVAVLRERRVTATVAWVVLLLDAVATMHVRPIQTALALAAIVLLGLAVAALVRSVAAVALATGLLAVPPTVAAALHAGDIDAAWTLRGAVAASALLLVALPVTRRVGRLERAALTAVLVSAAAWPALATIPDRSPGVYGGISMVLVAAALALLPRFDHDHAVAGVAADPGVVLLAIGTLLPALTVTLRPFAGLGAIWSGTFSDFSAVAFSAAVALALLAVASSLYIYSQTRRVVTAVAGLAIGGPTAVLLAVAHAPGPALGFVALALGLTLVLRVALTDGGWGRWFIAIQGTIYTCTGVAASLGLRWSTLTALGVVVVATAIIAFARASIGARVTGAAAAVQAAGAEAVAAGFAATLTARVVGVILLVVAAAAILGGGVLARRRPLEARAAQGAAHGLAGVAICLSIPHAVWAAALVAAWGIVVGGRALLPGTSVVGRRTLAAVAAGLQVIAWWILLDQQHVTLVEAYTLPLATAALLAGWAALRARPALRSWVAFGPALLAGFLPSLAPVLVAAENPWRRVGLIAAGIAVVIVGAMQRRQAPVVVAGVVLVVVALHEIVLASRHVPGWIPLALGGAILLFLAITYERRRRDLARLGATLRSLS